MSAFALLGMLPTAVETGLGGIPAAASGGRVLLGLIPIYAFALLSAIGTFWWVGRLISSDTPDDDGSDDEGGSGGGGAPRRKPRPHGPFGDGPAPIEPTSPLVRASRGDVHEAPVRGRRRREHAPHPVRAPVGDGPRHG